jgi:hypothetical protein
MNPIRSLFLALSRMPPTLILLTILGLAVVVTDITMSLHGVAVFSPRVQMSPTELTKTVLWLSAVLFTSVLSLRQKYSPKRNVKLAKREASHAKYLNVADTQTYPVLVSEAWKGLKETVGGEVIKSPDIRATHWDILATNEKSKTLDLVLRYVPTPLGRKPWNLYSRKLTCTASLSGRGTKCELKLIFKAQSPMDYRTLKETIEATKEALGRAICNPPEASILENLDGGDKFFNRSNNETAFN